MAGAIVNYGTTTVINSRFLNNKAIGGNGTGGPTGGNGTDGGDAAGAIYNAGMGFFNRAAVLTGPGVQLGGEENPPTAELVRENWDRINTLEGAGAISDATAATFSLVSPPGQGQEKKTNTNGTP